MTQNEREARYAEAMSGIEVWVGFRDEAGDDDSASGTIERDDLRALARVVMAVADAEQAALVEHRRWWRNHALLSLGRIVELGRETPEPRTSEEYRAAGLELLGPIEARAEAAEAEVRDLRAKVAAVEALHSGTHWCFDTDGQDVVFERGTQWWPCSTLAALASVGRTEPEGVKS